MESGKANVAKLPESFPSLLSLGPSTLLTTVSVHVESSSPAAHKISSSCCSCCGSITYLRKTVLSNVEMITASGSWTHSCAFGNTFALLLLLLHQGPSQWREENQMQGEEQEKQMSH